jgi:hypothetical protein
LNDFGNSLESYNLFDFPLPSQRHGASLEEVSSAMSAARDAYRNASNEIKLMDRFINVL